MKKIVSLALVATLTVALSLTGACANLSDDRTRTQAEGATMGGGGGALLGGILGAVIDGKDGAVKGALIGATLGTFLGLAYGTSVANRKAEYATEEEWLNECLKEAQKVNQGAVVLNDRLKTTLAAYSQGSGSYAFNTDGQSDNKQASQALKRDLKDGQEYYAFLDREITSHQEVISSTPGYAQTKNLRKQVDEMKKQKQLLEKNNRELAAINNRIAM